MSSSNGKVVRRSYDGDTFFVGSEEWKVGDRYELLRLLGSGSFSSVCLAVDKETGEQVALKRVADVLSSPEAARKTLREVCILRRLTGHPCIIRLVDAFVRPSTAGPKALSPEGVLTPLSVDVYIAMEPSSDGDLFSLRGHVSAATARSLVGQIASALEYIHKLGVWHRDLKSSNVLLFRDAEGKLVAKLADFGSARSAVSSFGGGAGGGGAAAAAAKGINGDGANAGEENSRALFQHSDSLAQALDEAAARPEDLVANPMRDDDEGNGEEMERDEMETAMTAARKSNGGSGAGTAAASRKSGGWAAPLTRLVATPLYRAPEVCLGRVEQYSSAIDMWSLGCVMGELLQRVPRVGSAATPALSVAPLFAVQQQRGGRNNIASASSYGSPGSTDELMGGGSAGAAAGANPSNPSTAAAVARAAVAELDALFKVVGTPTRADIAAVESLPWRRHLSRLRCRAPTLQRRLGSAAGEVALSLLAHLLAFDPARRASASEALAHEYFHGWSVERDLAGLFAEGVSEGAGANANAAAGAGSEEASPSVAAAANAAPAATAPAATAATTAPPQSQRLKHYYDEPDPAAALALLEREADAACQGYVSSLGCGDTPGGGVTQTESSRRSEAGIPALRALLEAECASLAAAAAEARRRRREEGGGGGGSGSRVANSFSSRLAASSSSLPSRPPQPPPRRSTASYLGSGSNLSDLEREQSSRNKSAAASGAEAPVEAQVATASRAFGAHVADAVKGTLEPSQFLSPGRHGEWTDAPAPPGGKAPGPAWGVSLPADEKTAQAIRRQQAR